MQVHGTDKYKGEITDWGIHRGFHNDLTWHDFSMDDDNDNDEDDGKDGQDAEEEDDGVDNGNEEDEENKKLWNCWLWPLGQATPASTGPETWFNFVENFKYNQIEMQHDQCMFRNYSNTDVMI